MRCHAQAWSALSGPKRPKSATPDEEAKGGDDEEDNDYTAALKMLLSVVFPQACVYSDVRTLRLR